jgi:hypothetical protein
MDGVERSAPGVIELQYAILAYFPRPLPRSIIVASWGRALAAWISRHKYTFTLLTLLGSPMRHGNRRLLAAKKKRLTCAHLRQHTCAARATSGDDTSQTYGEASLATHLGTSEVVHNSALENTKQVSRGANGFTYEQLGPTSCESSRTMSLTPPYTDYRSGQYSRGVLGSASYLPAA